jgi:hypothetical protein
MPSCDGSRPIGQSGRSAGLQTHRSGGVQNCPVVQPNATLRRVMGLSAPGEQQTKSKALLSAPRGISAICPASEAAEPRGAREACMPAQVATQLQKARVRTAANTEGIDAEEPASTSVRVQQRGCARGASDCEAVKLLSTQIVRKQAKAIFHLQRRGTLHATSSSTLPNSTNGWLAWQWRS